MVLLAGQLVHFPVVTQRKLNVQRTFIWRLMGALWIFHLVCVSTRPLYSLQKVKSDVVVKNCSWRDLSYISSVVWNFYFVKISQMPKVNFAHCTVLEIFWVLPFVKLKEYRSVSTWHETCEGLNNYQMKVFKNNQS